MSEIYKHGLAGILPHRVTLIEDPVLLVSTDENLLETSLENLLRDYSCVGDQSLECVCDSCSSVLSKSTDMNRVFYVPKNAKVADLEGLIEFLGYTFSEGKAAVALERVDTYSDKISTSLLKLIEDQPSWKYIKVVMTTKNLASMSQPLASRGVVLYPRNERVIDATTSKKRDYQRSELMYSDSASGAIAFDYILKLSAGKLAAIFADIAERTKEHDLFYVDILRAMSDILADVEKLRLGQPHGIHHQSSLEMVRQLKDWFPPDVVEKTQTTISSVLALSDLHHTVKRNALTGAVTSLAVILSSSRKKSK